MACCGCGPQHLSVWQDTKFGRCSEAKATPATPAYWYAANRTDYRATWVLFEMRPGNDWADLVLSCPDPVLDRATSDSYQNRNTLNKLTLWPVTDDDMGDNHATVPPIRTIDMFCGAGGSSWGARVAGATIAAGFDLWPVAGDVYRDNFPEARHFSRRLEELTNLESLKSEIKQKPRRLLWPWMR
jgi:hypothetical protein